MEGGVSFKRTLGTNKIELLNLHRDTVMSIQGKKILTLET